ncbi:hypothetical protein MKEN_00221600 [Mycena kentingensis (nom. inval.)]|nr:hypothetical protein MKEN_00221600 [Mycena kentingensis (nom. inval.)]
MPLKRLLRKLSKPKLHDGDHGCEYDSSASSWSDDSASRPCARTPAPFTAAFSANAREIQGKDAYAALTVPVLTGAISTAESSYASSKANNPQPASGTSKPQQTQYHLPRPRIETLYMTWEEQQMEADRVTPLGQSGYANANATGNPDATAHRHIPDAPPSSSPDPADRDTRLPRRRIRAASASPKPKTAGLLNADSAKMLVSVNRSLDADKERKKGFLENVADGAFGAEEVVGSADASGIIRVVKGIVTSDVVKTVGSTILDHMPAIMGTLEAISTAHPFIQLAFLPFKFAYEQEKVNHDNQKWGLRLCAALTIANTLQVHIAGRIDSGHDARYCRVDNMSDSIKQSCVGPDEEHYKSRLTEVCRGIGKEMRITVFLDAMQKQGKIVKFLNANAWHDKLALAKANFATWKKDLGLALQLKPKASVGNMEQMPMKTFMEEFKAYRTVQELRMEQLMTTNGWRAKDAQENTSMCEQLLAIERDDADTVGHAITGKESGKQDRVAELRRQLRADVGKVVQDNLRDFAELLSFKLSELQCGLKEDMRKGFEIIEVAIQGPARRVGDKVGAGFVLGAAILRG